MVVQEGFKDLLSFPSSHDHFVFADKGEGEKMGMENESIIRKIQKLLALSNSPNEAEATLAASRAQELLAQHNLEYAMVQDAVVQGGTNQPQQQEKRDKVRMKRSAMYRWQRDLWKVIAEANFCWWSLIEVWEDSPYKKDVKRLVKRHLILGRESNVIAVQMLGEYICDTIERLLPYDQKSMLSRSAVSWRKGCAERLQERIQAQAEERKRESERSTKASDGALILLRDVYEREYEANYDFKHGEGSYRRKLLQDAEWEQGQAAREQRAAEYEAQKEREWLEYLAKETPEQKKQRERKEAKEQRAAERRRGRWHRSWRNENIREASRTDREAYNAGKQAGENISLNQQVSDNHERRLGS